MAQFVQFVFSPAGLARPSLAVAASRAGELGVLDAEFDTGTDGLLPSLEMLGEHSGGSYGLRLPAEPSQSLLAWLSAASSILPSHLIAGAQTVSALADWLADWRAQGGALIVELDQCRSAQDDFPGGVSALADGWIARGDISVDGDSAFVVLQSALRFCEGPVYVRGALGVHSAAAAAVLGAAGIVLDAQVALLRESPLSHADRDRLHKLANAAPSPIDHEQGRVVNDACRAADWARRYGSVARALAAIRKSVRDYPALAQTAGLLNVAAPFAIAMGSRLPLVQAPVVSSPVFAGRVADEGAVPVVPLGNARGEALTRLIDGVRTQLAERPWGLSVSGGAKPDLLAAQLDAIGEDLPAFALVSGDGQATARVLDKTGVPCFRACSDAREIAGLLREGAKRIALQACEAGGPVTLTPALALWDDAVTAFLDAAADDISLEGIDVLFGGGIHDAATVAATATLAAPLAAHGVRIGFQCGTAYLRIRDLLECEAVSPVFQKTLDEATGTSLLRLGGGHAYRCVTGDFSAAFEKKRNDLSGQDLDARQIRAALEKFIGDRAALARSGRQRSGSDGRQRKVSAKKQTHDGVFPAGAANALCVASATVADLHTALGEGARAWLAEHAGPEAEVRREQPEVRQPACDIAIVGVGCILPGSGDSREFWQNILDRVDAISEIPAHRWDWRLYFDEDRTAPDKIYSRWGGFLADLPFNPLDYGIPPNSIKAVDPLQLMTLEVLRQTLDDAGYLDAEYDRERVSVILGASGGAGDVGAQYAVRSETTRFSGELSAETAARLPEWTEDSFAGILLNVAAGRAANRFDFGGVNFTVDAACASSLTAIYQAVAELEDGRSDMVLAGGIDTVQGPFGYLCFSKTQALSPRGRCSTFDTSADGIVISEGLAAVALKRLADAERDGDRIYAVIKGVGGSSDGRAKSMTAPFPDGQVRALRRAYNKAGYSAASVGLFEAHGTGTVAGDTAELETVTRVLAEEGALPKQSVIGSVKTLIGHTKATAGVAGLIKSALALYHQTLPPHGNVTEPNGRIADPDSPLYLLQKAKPWLTRADVPRRASVSAFGFGGTNFHVTMEEHGSEYLPRQRPGVFDRWPAELLVWRASDRASLVAAIARSLHAVEHCAGPICLRDLAMTLSEALPETGHTAAVLVSDNEDPAERIRQLAARVENPGRPGPQGLFYKTSPMAEHGKVAVIFAGQGSQYPNMLRDLALAFPEIPDTLALAERLIGEEIESTTGGTSLGDLIYTQGLYTPADERRAANALMRTDIAQPALGVIEAGLWQIMQRLGLAPDMAAGHSYGEYAALYAAGVLSLEDLLTISRARGRFIAEAAEGADLGSMAAVTGAREDVERIAAAHEDLIVANHNGPAQSILSGSRASIDAVVDDLLQAGIDARRLAVGAAFHSSFVEPARERLAEYMGGFDFHPARFPVYSNTTAKAHADDPAALRKTLSEHLSRPVEFVAEIEAMYEAGARIFVGLGPKNVQSSLVAQILGERPHSVVRIDDQAGGLKGLIAGLGALLADGVHLDLAPLFTGRACRRVDLDRPDSLSRDKKLPQHLWMLNGGGARRISDPLPQPLTLEQVTSEKERKTAVADQVARADTLAQPPASFNKPVKQSKPIPIKGKEGKVADETGPAIEGQTFDHADAPAAMYLESERDAVLLTYQDTMRQFLQTQESVMMAYLTGASASQSVRPVRRIAPARMATMAAPAVRAVAAPRVAAPAPMQAAPMPPANGASTAAAEKPANGAAAPNGSGVARSANGAAAAGNGIEKPANGAARTGNGSAAVAAEAPIEVAPAASNGGNLDPASMTNMLLDVVEDRTGYPRDMLGMDQNMEADLGIDSIKRVEIVGALLKTLPTTYVEGLGGETEELNDQTTLQGIVDWLASRVAGGGGEKRPFEQTGEGNALTGCAPLPRFTIQAQPEPVADSLAGSLDDGLHVVVDDDSELGEALAAALSAGGAQLLMLRPAELADPASARQRFADARAEHGPVRALLHVVAAQSAPVPADATLADWQGAIWRNEESLCQALYLLADDLRAGGRVLVATGQGGHFSRHTAQGEIMAQGGSTGLLKSINDEWEDTRVKAVDLDRSRSAADNVQALLAELTLPGGRLEVGYPSGERTIFRTLESELSTTRAIRQPAPDWVVLATGGARGITAEVLSELAPAGLTLVIVGRTPLPGAEDAALAGIDNAAGLRRALLEQARDEGRKPRPVEIEKAVAGVLRDREIVANIEGFRASGATVDYRVADVRDEAGMAELFNGIYASYGRLDGVVHGAGIIEDKLFLDKPAESRARVMATKIDSAWLIARHLRPETLQFLIFFTSVAGRYGNTGQTDYAAANEILNRLAWQLAARYEGKVKVAALNWGPWLGTRHGAGMVSDEARRKFEGKGVTLVAPETGRRIFLDEIAYGPTTDVEVIAGEGPWEWHETQKGTMQTVSAPLDASRYPLLHDTRVADSGNGELHLIRTIDVEKDRFLQQHRIDDVPVLPAAVALELMAEVASSLWSERTVTEISDFRALRGIVMNEDRCEVLIAVATADCGAGDVLTPTVEIRPAGGGLPHYRGRVHLAREPLQPTEYGSVLRAGATPISAADAYRNLLFHGPCFQTVPRYLALDKHGCLVETRDSKPQEWLAEVSQDSEWLFDPGLIDSAPQMALVWAHAIREESALPSRFGRVRRFGSGPIGPGRMHFLVKADQHEHQVCADVAFVDREGRLRLYIEALECTSSPALNRLGGGWKGELVI